MFKYTSKEIVSLAEKDNFISNTYEKVLRLCDFLEYISKSKYGNMLALKGGTAINLWILDLPRLSVDADFDFCLNVSKEEMQFIRFERDDYIKKLMYREGYLLSNKSKFRHSLDSYVFSYTTTSKSNDVLKIEINYSDRCHIFNPIKSKMKTHIYENFFINVLCEVELIGTKVNALITRTTPRDVYDVYNLFKLKKDYDVNLIKKIAMFYITIGSDDRPIDFNNCIIKAINKIKKINFKTLKQTLIPVLKKSEKIVAEEIADNVIEIITAIFKLTKEERDYIDNFNKGIYEPNLLFKEYKINDISTHPMAIWKMNCILN